MERLERGTLLIVRETKGKIPNLPFVSLKKKILSNSYKLSIVFVSPKKAQKINKESRNKKYIPNTLAFPVSKKEGEIYMCLSKIRKESKNFGMNYQKFLAYLVIHSMLHLKGHDHSSRMDKEEARLMRVFKFSA